MQIATELPKKSKKTVPSIVRNKASDGLGSTAITPIEYGGLQTAFNHFNHELFDNQLPDLFIVYSRRARSGGHYAPKRYSGRNGSLDRDELSLNPDAFVGKNDEWVCSVLLHEMNHHWQEHFGAKKKRERYAYHDREWARQMESQGLQPTHNGMVGGRTTGIRMGHLIVPGGPFQMAFTTLEGTGWRLNLESTRHVGADKKPSNKTTFICPACNANGWGKPDSGFVCKSCLLDAVSELPWINVEIATDLANAIDSSTMQASKPGEAS